MNLIPNTSFSIVRQLDNVNDTNTYYVQAVIRNAVTDALIATVKLTDKGSQRFIKNWQVIADVSGLGTYISIVTSVYTNSAYTTLSQTYATEEHTYLVIQPPVSTMGNGGTTIVDYDKIKKFISDIKFPGVPVYDKELNDIKKNHDENIGTVHKKIDSLGTSISEKINGIKIPKYDDTELKNTISELRNELNSVKEQHKNNIKVLSDSYNSSIQGMKSHFDGIKKAISSFPEMNNYFDNVKTIMKEELDKVAENKRLTEEERNSMREEHNSVKEKYDNLTNILRSIPVDEEKSKINNMVKKLL